MPTETTASLLLSRQNNSLFGVFHAQYALQLNEGSRAVWQLQQLGRSIGGRVRRIAPVTPANLLWSGLLGLMCVAAPLELAMDEELSSLVDFASGNIRVAVLSPSHVAAIAEMTQTLLSGVLTVLPGSSIRADQYLHAERIGFSVAQGGVMSGGVRG